MESAIDFSTVTEISGDDVTAEQVDRIARRYYWAAKYCVKKDVLEVACGSGQGLGFLGSVASSVEAGDIDEGLLSLAKAHYQGRFALSQFDAQQMPFADKSKDVIIIFEALYYIPSLERFFAECRRVLRPGGHLLISTANKDLYDFNPSPHSHTYLGSQELQERLSSLGFEVHCFGDTPVSKVGWKQKLLRPLKKMAVTFHLIPKSMGAKKLLKKFVFGELVKMPAEIASDTASFVEPTPLAASQPDNAHKVILCAARLPS